MKIKLFSLVFFTTMSIGIAQSLDDLDSITKGVDPSSASKPSASLRPFQLSDSDESEEVIIGKEQKEQQEKKKKKKKNKLKALKANQRSDVASKKSSTKSQGDLANWTESFQTKAGLALHTPNGVSLGSMGSGKSLSLSSGVVIDGHRFTSALYLQTNSTREDFVEALKKAGII